MKGDFELREKLRNTFRMGDRYTEEVGLVWCGDGEWLAFISFPLISLIPSTTAGEANVREVLIAAASALKA